MVHGVDGDPQFTALPERMTGVGVAVPGRKVAAGDRQPQPVPGLHDMADPTEGDDELVDLTGVEKRLLS
jgi:hypothetical protein